jgi:serine/threonine protein kinase
MFLDANNCYYINDVGLYVFYPELSKILFYEEKKNKTLKFDKISMDDDESRIIFYDCSSTEQKTIFSKAKAVLCKKTDIFFKSQNDNDLFKNFFKTERLNKNLEPPNNIIETRGQIDYLLVIKSSQKPYHISKEEHRVLRIDWANKIIKYYGDKATFKINDFDVPQQYPIEKIYKPNELLIHPNDVFSPVDQQKYKEQLLLGGYGQSFDSDDNQNILFKGLLEKFKRESIIPIDFTDEKLKDFLDLLDSSLLKNSWYDSVKGSKLMENYITNISVIPSEHKLENLQETGIAGFYLINDYKEYANDKVLKFSYRIKSNEETNSYKILTFDLQKALKNRPVNLLEEQVARCGASNCYFIESDNENKYGMRLSRVIYSEEDLALYNFIIENIINSACNYYCSLESVIKDKDRNFPEISNILSFGFVKVHYKSAENPQTSQIGYIPFTVSPHKANYLQVKEYINKLCSKEEELKECNIEAFIKQILVQVYNFYVVMRPYFKFSHFDFKTDNILIDPETMTLYIIDFGNAQMNIYSSNRVYYLTNRVLFDPLEPENEYNWYIKNINNVFYSDNDIEVLIWWLINNFKQDELKRDELIKPPNKFNYYSYAKKILDYMEPINHEQTPMGNNNTLIGALLSKDNKDNFEGSLIIYRLYQIYTILEKKTSDCKIDTNLIKYGDDHFRKYVIDYNPDTLKKIEKYRSILLPLIQTNNETNKRQKQKQNQKGGNKYNKFFKKQSRINTKNKSKKLNKNKPKSIYSRKKTKIVKQK